MGDQPVAARDRRFIWDGWLMLREIEGSVGVPPANPTTIASDLRGLDLAGQAGALGQGGAGILPAGAGGPAYGRSGTAGRSEPRPQGSGSFAAGHGGPALRGAGGIGGLIAVNIADPEPNTPNGTFIYCYDGNGNVTQLVRPNNGTLSAKYDYDPYGNRVNSADSNEAVQPWRFSTKQFDAETGLQYYGYRYRDRERWISRDPLTARRPVPCYQFGRNSPMTFVDALGLVDVPSSQPTTTPSSQPCEGCCCADDVEVKIEKKGELNLAREMAGAELTVTAKLNFVQNGRGSGKCTFQWWEWTDTPNSEGQPQHKKLKDWNDMHADHPNLPLWEGWGAKYAPPCKGPYNVTVIDKPLVSGNNIDRYLYILVAVKSAPCCNGGLRLKRIYVHTKIDGTILTENEAGEGYTLPEYSNPFPPYHGKPIPDPPYGG